MRYELQVTCEKLAAGARKFIYIYKLIFLNCYFTDADDICWKQTAIYGDQIHQIFYQYSK